MAYPNHLIIEGLRDSYMADPDGSTLGIWLRCKFVNEATTPDGTPALALCSATERASVVTMQAIAPGAYGTCAVANGGGGTLMGLMSGNCNPGDELYGASNGRVSTSSGGGAVLVGYATSMGADGGYVTYQPAAVAA